ncbi:MAG: hypothetical protein AB7N80_11500 [Bdellovibrionales bacterium]
MIKAGASDPYGTKPRFIQIKNLELHGAATGNTFTSLTGATMTYGDSAGIWIQPSVDILLENNVIYDNAFGIFTMAKDGELAAACERITVRNSRVYGNGRVNNYYDHNFYIQASNPVIEGNYIGQTRAGSQGSSYKSRSSGEIFRYNYVEASARAIDLVHSEDQQNGIANLPDYGTDYVYGNIIVNDCSLGNCASNPIHYGGDNFGEQDNVVAVFNPGIKYRQRLYFFNNTVINKVMLGQSYRTHVFDLSLVGTTVEAWNNIFSFEGDSNFSWVESAGVLNLRGNNLVTRTIPKGDMSALASNYTINNVGSLVMAASPAALFVNPANNYNLISGAPAIDRATAVPAGITPDSRYIQTPLVGQPYMKANGILLRSVRGTAADLGANEF